MEAPPPELIEDAVAEILLHLPPDEPACLARASLVCRLWRRILSDPAFLRRYRRFHRTPPLLGFFDDAYSCDPSPRFVPTTAAPASPFSTAAFDSHHRTWLPLDWRHGRFLLRHAHSDDLLVWDPITGDREELYHPGIPYRSAAVLCAAPGCDHCDCHGRAAGWELFRVIELQTVLPADNPIKRASAIGYAEGVDVIFVGTDFGTFTVDLRSGLARKVSEHEIRYPVIPFTSFYTPDCACSKLPLPAETN